MVSLEASLSRSLASRMEQLGLDPAAERAAASVRVGESAVVVLDGSEAKRRYYEEFFKARALRGVRPMTTPAQAAVPALIELLGHSDRSVRMEAAQSCESWGCEGGSVSGP